jgi:hypothetical protein
MPYSPPKGVRPPQLEGKRTGRPKGSKNWASAWEDCYWGYYHANEPDAEPPTAGAALWQAFASEHFWEVSDFLESHDVI